MTKFTKKAIMDCFLNMLKRKNIDRVTVTDICEECGINRNTFYYYFSDIYDVLDSVLIEETEKNIDITEDATFYETYSKAASVIIEYRAAVIHVYNSRNRDIIEKYLHNTTEYLVGLFVKKYSKDHKLTEDPDGDIVSFKWWHYAEADTYEESKVKKNEEKVEDIDGLQISINRELAQDEIVDNIVLDGADTEKLTFTVPEDAKVGDTIHIILEGIDDGKFNLKSYQRVIITVK